MVIHITCIEKEEEMFLIKRAIKWDIFDIFLYTLMVIAFVWLLSKDAALPYGISLGAWGVLLAQAIIELVKDIIKLKVISRE